MGKQLSGTGKKYIAGNSRPIDSIIVYLDYFGTFYIRVYTSEIKQQADDTFGTGNYCLWDYCVSITQAFYDWIRLCIHISQLDT
jgi:hypothetical protein